MSEVRSRSVHNDFENKGLYVAISLGVHASIQHYSTDQFRHFETRRRWNEKYNIYDQRPDFRIFQSLATGLARPTLSSTGAT